MDKNDIYLKDLIEMYGIRSSFVPLTEDLFNSIQNDEIRLFLKEANDFIFSRLTVTNNKKKKNNNSNKTIFSIEDKADKTNKVINFKLTRKPEEVKLLFSEFLNKKKEQNPEFSFDKILSPDSWSISISKNSKIKVKMGDGTSNESGTKNSIKNEEFLKDDLIEYHINGENGNFILERESVIKFAKFLGIVPNNNLSKEELSEVLKCTGSNNSNRIDVKNGSIDNNGIKFISNNGDVGNIVMDVFYANGEGAKKYLSVKSFDSVSSGVNFGHFKMNALNVYNEKSFYSAIQVIDDILINKDKLGKPELDIIELSKYPTSKIIELHEQIGIEYEQDYSVFVDNKGNPKDEHKKNQDQLKKMDINEKTNYDKLMELTK